jgi:rhodanese-related sulfurtransferase
MVQQFLEFATNHSILVTAFFAVLGMLVWNIVSEQFYGASSIQPYQAALLINHEDAIVLDVREEIEYKQGHIINSVHIPLGKLSERMGRLEKYRTRPIITSCASGNRSAQMCSKLRKNGFEKVYNLKGGIYAWQNASLPLTKEK